ncbi:hypothetical protein VMCG_07283 [Cytospora schulzeri]|uniref:Uncharacterized protein n=1 Tax=Cytospora schulzeri TaxID=448051 RepID=A0A423WAH1_9PEZI|nr:hypothetical protein VMCG_07283 [Valsa malicola]
MVLHGWCLEPTWLEAGQLDFEVAGLDPSAAPQGKGFRPGHTDSASIGRLTILTPPSYREFLVRASFGFRNIDRHVEQSRVLFSDLRRPFAFADTWGPRPARLVRHWLTGSGACAETAVNYEAMTTTERFVLSRGNPGA